MNYKSIKPVRRKPVFQGRVSKASPQTFTLHSMPYGLSYAGWTAKWWKWLISIPNEHNPARDPDGRNAARNQNDENVWFLAGTVKPYFSAIRTCKIPFGKAILFPVIATEISFAECPKFKTESDLTGAAAKEIVQVSHLEVRIGDKRLKVLESCRVNSGTFDLTFPTNNIFGANPGASRAASDGFWVFLKPLLSGFHTIYFCGIEPKFNTEVMYFLNVS